MQPYNVAAVEQPVAKEDFAGLKRVADAVETPIMADESLCTLEDARQLADGRMVDQFNIRISKCGGLLAARQVAEIAAAAGLSCQMGAHPGESAILAAAGRHFATTTPNLRYLEGSAGGILLKQDIVDAGIGLGWGARAPALYGPGLGVQVNEAKLAPFVVERRLVEV
jgi:muconate cycloisomerase